jgi:hypothetical protein
MKLGSSGKRAPVCYNHHSVVHQIPSARQWRDAKNSLTLRQVWRLIPPPAPLLGGIKRGTSSMRPVSGTRYPDEHGVIAFDL